MNFRRTMLAIAILLAVCVIGAAIGVLCTHTLSFRLSAVSDETDPVIRMEPEGIVSCTLENGILTFTPVSAGQTDVAIGENCLLNITCRQNGFMTELDTCCFTGWQFAAGAITFFVLAATVLILIGTVRQLTKDLFSYASPLLIAISLMMIFTLRNTLASLKYHTVVAITERLMQTSSLFLLAALPLILIFTVAMLISNISLLKHEGSTWHNLLGSLIGFAFCLAVTVLLFTSDFQGSIEALRIHNGIEIFLGITLTYALCKMTGIILCGFAAAHHMPSPDQDYILILGCRLSRKGGLTPLLRGRVDKALQFAKTVEEKSGKLPVLIPCGGQGKDELTTEAAAMKAYLLEKGFPEERILCEDRSTNTWENMKNAKALMKPGTKAAFSTTNYHVFRSGVWAHRNGLDASGMGSTTKWYYWPNAFMREFVALIRANLKHELLTIAVIALFSILAANMLTL